MIHKIKYIIFILLIATTAIAGTKILGHMTPFYSERLPRPVKLDCGVVIREWQGTRTQKAVDKMNRLCTFAKGQFIPFIKARGISPKHDLPFNYSLSLLNLGRNYRELNDLKYRFHARFGEANNVIVWGYTIQEGKFSFVMSNSNHHGFSQTFVHELFHQLSIHYGIFDAHHHDDLVKAKVDERLASEFEKVVMAKL